MQSSEENVGTVLAQLARRTSDGRLVLAAAVGVVSVAEAVVHGVPPHPLHFETPPEAPSLSGYNSYTGLLYNAQEVFVIHMG